MDLHWRLWKKVTNLSGQDIKLSDLIEDIAKENNEISLQSGLPVIFANDDEHEKWRVAKNKYAFETEELSRRRNAYISLA
jgi:hypothetical protein